MASIVENVQVGDRIFCAGHTNGFGSVRAIDHVEGVVDAWIENRGEVDIPADWIAASHDGKLELKYDALPDDLKRSIAHAHDAEDRY